MCFMNPNGPSPEIELKNLKKYFAEVVDKATDCEVKLSKIKKDNNFLRKTAKEINKENWNLKTENETLKEEIKELKYCISIL